MKFSRFKNSCREHIEKGVRKRFRNNDKSQLDVAIGRWINEMTTGLRANPNVSHGHV